MDHARNDVLTCAALTVDQNGDVRAGDLVHPVP